MEEEKKKKKDSDEQGSPRGSTVTQVIMNSANIIDNADTQLFPNLYNQVQVDFATNHNVTITLDQLGWITGIRSLLQAVTTPIWGWWNDRHSRKKVLAFGCLLWGVFTLLMAVSVNFVELLLFRAVTGVGLAVIIPTTQSVIADYIKPAQRGKAFGWLGLTQIIGIIAGTIFATVFVESVPADWRLVFILWGVISLVMAALVMLFAKDPVRGATDPELATKGGQPPREEQQVQLAAFKEILTNRTFMFIVLQGIIGSLPWNAVLFMVAWFEYIGFDPVTAGVMFLAMAVGAAIGNLLGGVIGDYAARKSPKYGRIAMAQLSGAMGIPFACIIFLVIPQTLDSMYIYILFGFITTVLNQWPSTACNNPIFSEIFEPEIRGTVFSVDRAFEGSLASLGTVFVALIAASLGFINPTVDIPLLSAAVRQTNANALDMGMFYMFVIPQAISCALYTIVYFTYPRDFQKMRAILEARALKQVSQEPQE